MSIDAVLVRKNIYLPFEHGIGYECLGEALIKLSTMDSFYDPAYVWELLLLLSNGFEHIQRAMIEYTAPVMLKRNPDPSGPPIIILNTTTKTHNLLTHHKIIKSALKVDLTEEEESFFELLSSFQRPVHRYENTDGNLTKDNLEEMVVSFVKGVNKGHRYTQQLALETMLRNIQSIALKYHSKTPPALHYYSIVGNETVGETMKQALTSIGNIDELYNNNFNHHKRVRKQYKLFHDISIGTSLLRSGLDKLSRMKTLLDPSEAWVVALLLSNGMEKIIQATRLSIYDYLGEEFTLKINELKKDSTHNIHLVHQEIEALIEEPVNAIADSFVRFTSEAIHGYNRYECINFQKVAPDVERRLSDFATYGLFEGRYDEALVVSSPDAVAFKLEEEIEKLLAYYQGMGVKIPFYRTVSSPQPSLGRFRSN